MKSVEILGKTVQALRGPNGCPWDKAQTIESLTPYILEECYELVDAIKNGTKRHVVEECGDVLLQVMLISQIASETQAFSIDDVATYVNDKMIERHPHVFGESQVKTVDEVLVNWEKNKEKKEKKEKASLFATIPKSLPAMIQSEKIQKKVVNQGFDWKDTMGAVEKVKEELAELIEAIQEKEDKKVREELGDLLFSIANVARKCGLQSEDVVLEANQKFKKRYQRASQLSEAEGCMFSELNLAEQEHFWQMAKEVELP